MGKGRRTEAQAESDAHLAPGAGGSPRDAMSGLTDLKRMDWEEVLRGEGYDTDQLRRYIRSHGGHCSGGGGCC